MADDRREIIFNPLSAHDPDVKRLLGNLPEIPRMSYEDVMAGKSLVNAEAEAVAKGVADRPKYKSWRKKYRKMRYAFDDRMEEANRLFVANWRAEQVAKRIKEQNDQLMEILLDINESEDVAASKRIDLRATSSATATQALTPPTHGQRQRTDGTSIAALEAGLAYTKRDQLPGAELPDDLRTDDTTLPPAGYLTPAHEDEYLATMDEALEALPLPSLTGGATGHAVLDPNVDIRPRRHEPPTERDFAESCPVSVYQWLKTHVPSIHAEKENEKEKSRKEIIMDSDREAGRPGTPAGGGSGGRRRGGRVKKEDVPFEQLDDEIGFDPSADDPPFGASGNGGSGSGRRGRRGKDDEAYRPKGGKSRPSTGQGSGNTSSLGSGAASSSGGTVGKRKRDGNDAGGPDAPGAGATDAGNGLGSVKRPRKNGGSGHGDLTSAFSAASGSGLPGNAPLTGAPGGAAVLPGSEGGPGK